MVRRRHDAAEKKGRSARRKAGKYIRALMCITGRHESAKEDEKLVPPSSDQLTTAPSHPIEAEPHNLPSRKDSLQEIDEQEIGGQDTNIAPTKCYESKELPSSSTKPTEQHSLSTLAVNETEEMLPYANERAEDTADSATDKEADTSHPPGLDHSSYSSSQSNREPQDNFEKPESFLGVGSHSIQNKPSKVDTSLAISNSENPAHWNLESPENDNPSPNAALSLQTLLGSSKTISRSSKPIASSTSTSKSRQGEEDHHAAVSSILSSSRFISSPKRRNSFSDRIEQRLLDTERSLGRSHSDVLDCETLVKEDWRSPSSDPHSYLLYLLQKRGYEGTTYKSLSTAYYNTPTEYQLASYGPALLQSVRMNDTAAFGELLEHLSCNPCTSRGESLLHMLCRKGNHSQLEILLDRAEGLGWSQAVDFMGRTPLHDCCWRNDGNTKLPKFLLDRNPVWLLLEDAKGIPPLSYVPSQQWQVWTNLLDDNVDQWFPGESSLSESHEIFDACLRLAQREPNSVPLQEETSMSFEVVSQIAAGSRLRSTNNSNAGPIGIISGHSLLISDYVSDLDDSTNAENDSDDFSLGTDNEDDEEEEGVANLPRPGIAPLLMIHHGQ